MPFRYVLTKEKGIVGCPIYIEMGVRSFNVYRRCNLSFFKVTSRNFAVILEMGVSSFHVTCCETIYKLKELYKEYEKKKTPEKYVAHKKMTRLMFFRVFYIELANNFFF